MTVTTTRSEIVLPSYPIINKQSEGIGQKFKHFWGYTSKTLQCTRYYLNGFARNTFFIDMTPVNTSNYLKSTATHLKLLSIVGIPYKLSDIHGLSGSLLKSFVMNDYEGIKLGVLSMALIVADLMDSTLSYINGVLAVTLAKPFEVLPSLSLPLGLTMSTTGSVLRIIKITKAYNLHQNLQVNESMTKTAQIAYLNKCLGIDVVEADIRNATTEDLKLLQSKKEATINRAIPKEARESFNHVINLLKQAPETPLREEQYLEIQIAIDHIQVHLKEKGQVDVIGLLSNILIITAVICLKVGIATSLPYFIFAIAFTIRLGIHIYEKNVPELSTFHKSLEGPLSL